MPRQKTYLEPKPEKKNLLVPRGRKREPESIEEALRGMKPGEKREGFLGGDLTKKPDYMPRKEILDNDGLTRKKAIKDLLINVIQPVSLGMKSTPEMDRRSLINKFNKLTLNELVRFLPERVNGLATEQLQHIANRESDIFEEEKAEIQQLYMNISP